MNLFIKIFNYLIEQTFVCGDVQRVTQQGQATGVYKELALARELATVTATVTESLQRLNKRQRSRETSFENKNNKKEASKLQV